MERQEQHWHAKMEEKDTVWQGKLEAALARAQLQSDERNQRLTNKVEEAARREANMSGAIEELENAMRDAMRREQALTVQQKEDAIRLENYATDKATASRLHNAQLRQYKEGMRCHCHFY